jgi:hypothetical protein
MRKTVVLANKFRHSAQAPEWLLKWSCAQARSV